MRKCLLFALAVSLLLASVPFLAAAETEVPFLTELYQGVEVKLRLLDGEGRAISFSGPGKDYFESGGYKPYKQQKITVYYRDNGWYLTDVVYRTAEERFVYFRKPDFEDLPDGIPEVESLPSWEGVTLGTIFPAWGPGSRFNRVEKYAIPDGTEIKVFFQENGFVYAEYVIAEKKTKTRMWLPADQIALKGATVTVTDETQKPYTISQFGKEGTASAQAPEPPRDGSWSAWSDVPIEAADGIEVETRTLYRRKNEIADWTPWIDGDGDASNPFVEVREVTDENGIVRHQYREFGYHYHYGDWNDWSEDPWRNVASSSDITESKTQYRCRRVK